LSVPVLAAQGLAMRAGRIMLRRIEPLQIPQA